VLFNEDDLQHETLTIDELFQVGADGTWSGEVTVPAAAEPGDYTIVAACSAGASATEEPFLIYQPQGFTVTGAGVTAPAQPAAPISATPTLTG